MEKNNKKTLAIMLGTLLFLLVIAVVLLSVIIVSLTVDKDPLITTGSQVTQAPPVSGPSSSDTTQSQSTPIISDPTADTKPQTSFTTPPVTDDNPATTSPKTTTQRTPITTAPVVVRPPVTSGDVETVTNADGSVVKRGSFRDNGEQKLHLLVDWEAYYPEKNSKNVTLTVRLYLESNTIGVAARTNGVFTVGDDTITYSTERLAIRENATHHTLFVTRTLNYTKSNAAQPLELDISAAWNFDGSYSGVRIDWIRVSSTIEI